MWWLTIVIIGGDSVSRQVVANSSYLHFKLKNEKCLVQGKFLEEEYFNVALPVILEMIFIEKV